MACGECEEPPGLVDGCRCDGGQPKNFLRPCLLLLLAEQPAHGYELLERLKAFGIGRDPGGLYRALRSMERDGLVESRWESSDFGPDRCRYELTRAGHVWLGAWADTLDETRRVLEGFLGRYHTLTVSSAVDRLLSPEPAARPAPVFDGDRPAITRDEKEKAAR